MVSVISPQFIGTYSLLRPHKDTLENTESSLSSQEEVLPVEDVTKSSPGSQIYQTLDKYMEELETFMEDSKTNKDMYDRLFDDPNYSPINTSHAPSLFSSVPSGPKLTQYDKLASKPSDSDYAYAYSHMAGKRKKTRKNQPPKNEDILHIADMGTYEMDPEFISTLRSQKQESLTTKNGLPMLHKNVVCTTEANKKAMVNCYQSLDHSTLTPDNSYTILSRRPNDTLNY